MSPVKKSFLSAGAVVLACTVLIGGKVTRDHADARETHSGLRNRSLLASARPEPAEISEGDFFALLMDILKREYVDPITDDNKLTTGAIRGMVTSLENPDCLFMDPKEFNAFVNARNGKYEGVGVDLALEMPADGAKTTPSSTEPLGADSPVGTRIPALVVAAVVPGGPADMAGVKPGDSVDTVDGHWVLNPYTLDEFRKLQKDVSSGAITQQKLIEVRKELRKKLQTSMMPLKAKDRLILGNNETIKVTWLRAGKPLVTSIQKRPSSLPALARNASGAISLHFQPGVASQLKNSLDASTVTLDLRNNAFGDFDEMKKCLAALAPSGTYGKVTTRKTSRPKNLQVENGTTKKRNITLMVDGSTRGVAEMFVLALKGKGLAKVTGPAMSANRNLIEMVRLPDGSGYTLVTGQYEPARSAA